MKTPKSAAPGGHPVFAGTPLEGWTEAEVTHFNQRFQARTCPHHDAPLVADFTANQWVCPQGDSMMVLDARNIDTALMRHGISLPLPEGPPLTVVSDARFPHPKRMLPQLSAWQLGFFALAGIAGITFIIQGLTLKDAFGHWLLTCGLAIIATCGAGALICGQTYLQGKHSVRDWCARGGPDDGNDAVIPSGMVKNHPDPAPTDLVGFPATSLLVRRDYFEKHRWFRPYSQAPLYSIRSLNDLVRGQVFDPAPEPERDSAPEGELTRAEVERLRRRLPLD